MPGFNSRSLPATDMCKKKCPATSTRKERAPCSVPNPCPQHTTAMQRVKEKLQWRCSPSIPWAGTPEISARRRQDQTHCHKQQRGSAILSVLNIHACRWDLKRLKTTPEILPQACPGRVTAPGFQAAGTSCKPAAAFSCCGTCGVKTARAVQSSFSINKYLTLQHRKKEPNNM